MNLKQPCDVNPVERAIFAAELCLACEDETGIDGRINWKTSALGLAKFIKHFFDLEDYPEPTLKRSSRLILELVQAGAAARASGEHRKPASILANVFGSHSVDDFCTVAKLAGERVAGERIEMDGGEKW